MIIFKMETLDKVSQIIYSKHICSKENLTCQFIFKVKEKYIGALIPTHCMQSGVTPCLNKINLKMWEGVTRLCVALKGKS